MGQGQSYLANWVETVSTDQIYPELDTYYTTGDRNRDSILSKNDISKLRITFQKHISPQKSWNEASFLAFLNEALPPNFPNLQKTSHLLFALLAHHALYPFHSPPTGTSEPTDINSKAFIRAVVLLSKSKNRQGFLSGDSFAYTHDSRDASSDRKGISQTGRSFTDQLRWIFYSLSKPKPEALEKPKEEARVDLPENEQCKEHLPRNQHCYPRDIDVLDVLVGIQPRKDFVVMNSFGSFVDPVSRKTLSDVARRMPRGRLPEEWHVEHQHMTELLDFLSSFSIDHTGLKIPEAGEKIETATLFESFELGEKNVEWGVFSAFGENQMKLFERLYLLFDLLFFGKLPEFQGPPRNKSGKLIPQRRPDGSLIPVAVDKE